MATVRTICARCDGPTVATVVHGRNHGGAGLFEWQWAQCPGCQGGILIRYYGNGPEVAEMYPPPLPGGNVNDLPDDVSRAWDEARQSYGASAYTACELMCRKILMHVAVDKAQSAAGKKFVEYVNDLEAGNHFAVGLKDVIDKVRHRGNAATHELPASSQDEARQTMLITHYLLHGTYELPGLI